MYFLLCPVIITDTSNLAMTALLGQEVPCIDPEDPVSYFSAASAGFNCERVVNSAAPTITSKSTGALSFIENMCVCVFKYGTGIEMDMGVNQPEGVLTSCS